jgi:hypothetical protein
MWGLVDKGSFARARMGVVVWRGVADLKIGHSIRFNGVPLDGVESSEGRASPAPTKCSEMFGKFGGVKWDTRICGSL